MFARVREFALEMNSARCHRAIVPRGQRHELYVCLALKSASFASDFHKDERKDEIGETGGRTRISNPCLIAAIPPFLQESHYHKLEDKETLSHNI